MTEATTSTQPTSHDTSAAIPPVRREVRVTASQETAFALFTAHIGAWWPLEGFSVHGKESIVAFEGERLVERHGDGTAVWAEVVGWEAPSEVRLAWHPGGTAESATDLTVRFEPDGDSTIVTLIHSGWERASDPAGAAEQYGQGWPGVLACFEAQVGAVTEPSTAS
jgi:hypothetical protein